MTAESARRCEKKNDAARPSRFVVRARRVCCFGVLVLLLGAMVHCAAPVPSGCEKDGDCQGATPFCVQQVCRACRNDQDCASGASCRPDGLCTARETLNTEPSTGETISAEPADAGAEPAPERQTEPTPELTVPEPSVEPTAPEKAPEGVTPEPSAEPTPPEKTPEGVVEVGPEPVVEQPVAESGCVAGSKRPCYPIGKNGCSADSTGTFTCKGTCKAGEETCVAGAWSGQCQGAVVPVAERCDGKDDDCDGNIDNDESECTGSRQCKNGACVCPDGYAECAGRCVDIRQDNKHCGACSVACTSGTPCRNGVCACEPAANSALLWARQAGGMETDRADAVVSDAQGNLFVTGSFRASATFGSIQLQSTRLFDAFLAKLDSRGKWLWVKKLGGTGNDEGNGIALDSKGNILLTGSFFGTANFGNNISLRANGSFDVFLAKFDPSGKCLWARNAGDTGLDRGLAVTVDAQDNPLLVGSFHNAAKFGSSITLRSAGVSDSFVAKLDGTGKWLWAQKAGGVNPDEARSLATDSQGNVFIAGAFERTVSFGTTALSAKSKDGFVAKLDSSGNWLWVKQISSSGIDGVNGVSVDSKGNVIVTGSFQSTAALGATMLQSSGGFDAFVAKLDGAGNWLWAQKAGSIGDDLALDVTTDAQGDLLVTGVFHSNASFGSTTLQSAGNYDAFVAKLDGSGKWLWAQKAGGTGMDYGQFIDVDAFGNLTVVGRFAGSMTVSNTTLTTSPNTVDDLFVLRVTGPKLYCANQCIDPTRNTSHCGSCNNPCSSSQTCSSGSCQ